MDISYAAGSTAVFSQPQSNVGWSLWCQMKTHHWLRIENAAYSQALYHVSVCECVIVEQQVSKPSGHLLNSRQRLWIYDDCDQI